MNRRGAFKIIAGLFGGAVLAPLLPRLTAEAERWIVTNDLEIVKTRRRVVTHAELPPTQWNRFYPETAGQALARDPGLQKRWYETYARTVSP